MVSKNTAPALIACWYARLSCARNGAFAPGNSVAQRVRAGSTIPSAAAPSRIRSQARALAPSPIW